MKRAAVFGVVLALSLMAGVAVAADHDDIFTACLTPGGDLKDVEINVDTADCRGNSTPVTWNSEGVPGPPGDLSSLTSYEVSKVNQVDPLSTNGGGSGPCDAGDLATGGGFELLFSGLGSDLTIVHLFPARGRPTIDAWGAEVTNRTEIPREFVVYAVCLDLPPQRS